MIKRKAFSLLEISIVMAIISFLLFGIMQGGNLIKKSKVGSAISITHASPVPNIEGLTLWLETTMPGSLKNEESVNGALVSTWYDISNSRYSVINFSQEVSTSRPTYATDSINGLPAIAFNGSQLLTRASLISDFVQDNQGTIFIVIRYLSESGSVFIWEGSGSYKLNAHILLQDNNLYFNFDFGNCCGNDARTGDIISGFIKKNNIVSLVKYPASATTYINGSSFKNNSSANGSFVNQTSSSNMNIGSAFNGAIGEIIIYNRSLTDQERKDVETYLSKKWEITVS